MFLAIKRLSKIGMLITVLLVVLSPLATNISAQTPESNDPPVIQDVEPPVEPEPEPTEPDIPPVPDPVEEPEPPAPDPVDEPNPPANEPEEDAVDPPADTPVEPETDDQLIDTPGEGDVIDESDDTSTDGELDSDTPTDDLNKDGNADDSGDEENAEESSDIDLDEENTEDSPATPDAEPTPTEEPEAPDQIEVVGSAEITIQPGEYLDIAVRYTLGSDRDRTILSASLNAADGTPLDTGWKLDSLDRGDTYNNPDDPHRDQKVRLEIGDVVENGEVVTTTWRITAPDHIEVPIALYVDFVSEIHDEGGSEQGVYREALLIVRANASVHSPTLQCDTVIAEDVNNTWNCAFDTTHSDPILVEAAASVPEGWELALNGEPLTSEGVALDQSVVEAGAFELAAKYPIGCPDPSEVFSTTLSLTFNYPSGEVSTLVSDQALVFHKPTPKLEVTGFSFEELVDIDSLSTTGQLTLRYSDAPCGWQATLEFGDLTSELGVIDDVVIVATGFDGNPELTVTTTTDNTIVIVAPENTDENSEGEITINLRLDLPTLIPPGDYVIQVITELISKDSL